MPGVSFWDVPEEKRVPYACRDADATLRITPILDRMIDEMGLRQALAIDMGVVPMVERMQSNGMLADVGHFEKLGTKLATDMAARVRDIDRLCGTGRGFNPNSGDQVAFLLFGKLGLTARRLTKGGTRESTDDATLETLRGEHPVVPLIADYREMAKLRDSFCVVLPQHVSGDGRIRCNLRITRVSSGRLSATGPNLLAMPTRTELGREIRKGFVAPKGCVLGSWDLDQIEMRVMAHESEDDTMMNLFQAGRDIHLETAAMIYGKKLEQVSADERYAAKRVGFGVITGIAAAGLLVQMHQHGALDWTETRCQKAIERFFHVCSGVLPYIEKKRAEARRYGFVRDMWGRIRYLPGVWSPIPRIRAEAERQAHSHAIQAGAQGIIKRAMAVVWEYLDDEWRAGYHIEPLLQIHDELLFELENNKKRLEVWGPDIQDILCGTTALRVPVKARCAFGPNWGVLK